MPDESLARPQPSSLALPRPAESPGAGTVRSPVRERFDRECNRPLKTKLKINHERILLKVQRGHGLRTRARLLVLRSPARTAGSRPGDDRMSLPRLPGDEAEATPDSCQHHQRLRERPIHSLKRARLPAYPCVLQRPTKVFSSLTKTQLTWSRLSAAH